MTCWSRISAPARSTNGASRATGCRASIPRLTILRVTGFGQTGPYRDTPGFARVFEAMSGFTRMCGEEGGTPLHLGYPISDAIGGLFGAIGVLADLYRLKSDPNLRGQEIDCSVTEAMMRTLDFLAIEYDQLGTVRTQSGNRSQYAAPGNIYAHRRTASGPRSRPRRKAFSSGFARRSALNISCPTRALSTTPRG